MNMSHLYFRSLRTSAAVLLTLAAAVTVPSPAVAQDRSREAQMTVHRFDDHDRQEAEGWYRDHQRALPLGLRDRDRLPVDLERRLDVGVTLDRDLRGRVYSVPRDLLIRLSPAPRGFRYAFIGGHLCLLDGANEVHDVIHLGHERS